MVLARDIITHIIDHTTDIIEGNIARRKIIKKNRRRIIAEVAIPAGFEITALAGGNNLRQKAAPKSCFFIIPMFCRTLE
ncbi:hypothetical protein A2935_00240 [Candidatus Wolfebacteria bacterium RIFCSPLOWO2_01_FULL_47_17b]|nr:MAG: hypothetical protein A2935_00240 [Candidatus Wolfebacteria bacterium RIFCSPLOWO2_01_FULL_47_17b]